MMALSNAAIHAERQEFPNRFVLKVQLGCPAVDMGSPECDTLGDLRYDLTVVRFTLLEGQFETDLVV
jgi:hypothetical protein